MGSSPVTPADLEVLQEQLGRTPRGVVDVAARYGGDEFMSLLVDTPVLEAHKVADRIRHAVAQIDVGLGPTRIDIGVAGYGRDGHGSAELIRVADQRMYAAKQVAV